MAHYEIRSTKQIYKCLQISFYFLGESLYNRSCGLKSELLWPKRKRNCHTKTFVFRKPIISTKALHLYFKTNKP